MSSKQAAETQNNRVGMILGGIGLGVGTAVAIATLPVSAIGVAVAAGASLAIKVIGGSAIGKAVVHGVGAVSNLLNHAVQNATHEVGTESLITPADIKHEAVLFALETGAHEGLDKLSSKKDQAAKDDKNHTSFQLFKQPKQENSARSQLALTP